MKTRVGAGVERHQAALEDVSEARVVAADSNGHERGVVIRQPLCSCGTSPWSTSLPVISNITSPHFLDAFSALTLGAPSPFASVKSAGNIGRQNFRLQRCLAVRRLPSPSSRCGSCTGMGSTLELVSRRSPAGRHVQTITKSGERRCRELLEAQVKANMPGRTAASVSRPKREDGERSDHCLGCASTWRNVLTGGDSECATRTTSGNPVKGLSFNLFGRVNASAKGCVTKVKRPVAAVVGLVPGVLIGCPQADPAPL
jgi:hypothetical protein